MAIDARISVAGKQVGQYDLLTLLDDYANLKNVSIKTRIADNTNAKFRPYLLSKDDSGLYRVINNTSMMLRVHYVEGSADNPTERFFTPSNATSEVWLVIDVTESTTKKIIRYATITAGNPVRISYVNTLDKNINTWSFSRNQNYLACGSNNSEYSPTYDYDPATKKYVDDAIEALRASLTSTTEETI